MKTATKSSWSKVAQDLYGRWFVQEYVQREKAAKKETNKHKNGSLSPVSSSYFLPNLRLTISKFSNFSSKMLSNLQETRENIRSCSVEIFCTLPKSIETTQVFLSKKKKKKVLGDAWSRCFDQFSQLDGDKLCSGLSLQRLRRQSQGTEDSA